MFSWKFSYLYYVQVQVIMLITERLRKWFLQDKILVKDKISFLWKRRRHIFAQVHSHFGFYQVKFSSLIFRCLMQRVAWYYERPEQNCQRKNRGKTSTRPHWWISKHVHMFKTGNCARKVFRGFSSEVVPPPPEQMLLYACTDISWSSNETNVIKRYLFFSQVKRSDVSLGIEQVGY